MKEKLVKRLSLDPASAFSSLRIPSRVQNPTTTFLGVVVLHSLQYRHPRCYPSNFNTRTSIFRNLITYLYSETHISSSTVLTNNLQNLRGKILLLQSPPFWTIVDKTGIDK